MSSHNIIHHIPIQIKLFDSTLPIPTYQTTGAAGFDLYSRTDLILPPHHTTFVPLNIALNLPPTHWLLLAARSSLHKKGLQLINGVGIGDSDYCGNDDEYQALLYNFSSQPTSIHKGERLVQGILLPLHKADFSLTTSLSNPNRGGIGSTGS